MAFGPGSIVLIVGAGLILFGPKKLPEFGKSLGETLREFKKATKGLVDEEPTEADSVSKRTASEPIVKAETVQQTKQKVITIRSGQPSEQGPKRYKVVSKKEEQTNE